MYYAEILKISIFCIKNYYKNYINPKKITGAIRNATVMIKDKPGRPGSPTEGTCGLGSHISSAHGSGVDTQRNSDCTSKLNNHTDSRPTCFPALATAREAEV